MNTKNNIARFEQLMAKVNRPGVDKLMNYIKTSDFYTAPASTRFHLSVEGGLLQHSLNVYDRLASKLDDKLIGQELVSSGVSEESIIIVALLHDLCKTNFYSVSMRNVKNESSGQWEKVPYFTVDDKIPYGHGEKSAMMVESYIKLSPPERYAIRWHMGYSEPKEYYSALNTVLQRYPLALALYEADLEASNLMESEKDNKITVNTADDGFEEC